MNRQTQVKNMKVRREGALLSEEAPRTGAELTELPQKDGWGKRLLRADKLVRNLAVVGAMLLTVIAVKNAGSPDAQSVFGALQASTEMEWDESLGKLSFVGGILPDGIQAVWSEKETVTVFEPMAGDTVHAWSQSEPYMAFMSTVRVLPYKGGDTGKGNRIFRIGCNVIKRFIGFISRESRLLHIRQDHKIVLPLPDKL